MFENVHSGCAGKAIYLIPADLGRNNEFHHCSYSKSILKLVKLQCLVASINVAKRRKFSPRNFEIFVEICTNFESIVVQTSVRSWYKNIQNMRNLQSYIFRISQHFATKLCNFTNFKLLFLAVVMDFFLPAYCRSKFIL